MNFFRRRKNSTISEGAVVSGADARRADISRTSVQTTCGRLSTEAGHPFALAAARHRHAALPQRTNDVGSITDTMTSRWYGVDDATEQTELMTAQSNGTNVRSWLEKQPQLRSPCPSDGESRQEAAQQSQMQTDAKTSKPKMIGLRGCAIVSFCMALMALETGLMFTIIPGDSPLMNRDSFRNRPQAFPSREKFFRAVLYDDSRHKFSPTFSQGLVEAGDTLRVNVSVTQTDNMSKAIGDIADAADALYDGLIISTAFDERYLEALITKKEDNHLVSVGALESVRYSDLGTSGHVGDSETQIGILTGKAFAQAGKKTSLCLCHSSNAESVFRCKGFTEGFQKQTYEINLKTAMQSELKSKLIPIILDDSEIDALFVSDSDSFQLVHQILKSLNKLCLNTNPVPTSRCIYFGAYGTDTRTIQVLKNREVQLIVDPQQYLRGYLSTTLMTLQSIGFRLPTAPSHSLLLSRLVTSTTESKRLLSSASHFTLRSGAPRSLNLIFYLFGKKPRQTIQHLKEGIRLAARDFGVEARLRHFLNNDDINDREIAVETDGVDGVAVAVTDTPSLLETVRHYAATGKPLITFGAYYSDLFCNFSSFHVGHIPEETDSSFESAVKDDAHRFDENASLQGYLSVVFLVINHTHRQAPSGFFDTAVIDRVSRQ